MLFNNRQIPFYFFIKSRSVNVNNKLLSYQASEKYDLNQISKKAGAEATVEDVTESAIPEDLNAFDADPEVPYMDKPLAGENWIAEYSREVRMHLIHRESHFQEHNWESLPPSMISQTFVRIAALLIEFKFYRCLVA